MRPAWAHESRGLSPRLTFAAFFSSQEVKHVVVVDSDVDITTLTRRCGVIFLKIIVGITGATGVIYGVRLLEVLKEAGVETHLIMSEWAEKNLALETPYTIDYVKGLADWVYNNKDMGARISSGSFKTDGMVIVPCSMKTLAGLAHGYSENLIIRAGDVCLKEGRRLIIAPRETPLNAIHLENMLKLARLGVRIVPPVPSFYHKPQTIADLINQFVGRLLDQLQVENNWLKRWGDTE